MFDYRYALRDVYEPRVEDFEIKTSTSADGWKYHKPSKKRKNRR